MTRRRVDESATQRVIRYNFLASVWLMMLAGIANLTYLLRNPEVVLTEPAPFPERTPMGVLVLIVMFAAAWYRVYRRAGNPARILAALFGALLLAILAIQLGRAAIDVPTDARLTLLLGYVMASHFIYAIFGSRLRLF